MAYGRRTLPTTYARLIQCKQWLSLSESMQLLVSCPLICIRMKLILCFVIRLKLRNMMRGMNDAESSWNQRTFLSGFLTGLICRTRAQTLCTKVTF